MVNETTIKQSPNEVNSKNYMSPYGQQQSANPIPYVYTHTTNVVLLLVLVLIGLFYLLSQHRLFEPFSV